MYSIIVPVYNRPDEVDELLQSLCRQTFRDFEVIIVEDGSQTPCREVCEKYREHLNLKYFDKPNSGPGQSRNYGAERAAGEWLIILDSDVVLPEGYMAAVDLNVECRVKSVEFATATEATATTGKGSDTSILSGRKQTLNSTLYTQSIAAFGGPDTAHPDFTPVQKAISYSMTSFFTTGGIRGGSSPVGRNSDGSSPRGGKKRGALDKFFPRSYNMGIRREVYLQLGGFSKMRFGEDIDFSYRIVEAGYKTALFPEAWVWHKRRTDFRKFFRQVYNSGIARINLTKRHPGTLKLVHLLPTVFTVGVIALILTSAAGRLLMYYQGNDQWRWLCLLPWAPILLYSLLIFVHSTLKNKSLYVGLLSVPAAFTQLMGYGLGFISAWWKRCVLKKDESSLCEQPEAERTAFEKNFYK